MELRSWRSVGRKERSVGPVGGPRSECQGVSSRTTGTSGGDLSLGPTQSPCPRHKDPKVKMSDGYLKITVQSPLLQLVRRDERPDVTPGTPGSRRR